MTFCFDTWASVIFVVGLALCMIAAVGILYIGDWGAMDTVVHLIPDLPSLSLPDLPDRGDAVRWWAAFERNDGISAKFVRV